jgi:exosortase
MASTATEQSRLAVFPAGVSWWLVGGFAVLAVPTAISLAQQSWSREFGAYGPIIIAAGAWLLWRQIPEMRRLASPGRSLNVWPALAVAAILYIFGRAYDFLTLETAGVYGVGLTMLYAKVGPRAMLACWFPLLYLAFAIPPPNSILADITAPLKELVSWVATGILSHLGLPVAREGVVIFVAQYQLLVEDACSGMNSLVGLIAVSLLYIYLMRGSSALYALVLVCFVVPIAIIANIIRIMLLILMTYGLGNEVAQGILHVTAGLILFSTALLLVFGLDKLLFRAFRHTPVAA